MVHAENGEVLPLVFPLPPVAGGTESWGGGAIVVVVIMVMTLRLCDTLQKIQVILALTTEAPRSVRKMLTTAPNKVTDTNA